MEKRIFIITYHFDISPQKRFRISAESHLHALKIADKLPYKHLRERLNELESYDVEEELSEETKEKIEKSRRIGFSRIDNAKPKAYDPNEIPF